jgi:hypothetical protein
MRLFESAALNINWFPGHMASAARLIEQRLKVVDMVRHVCVRFRRTMSTTWCCTRC